MGDEMTVTGSDKNNKNDRESGADRRGNDSRDRNSHNQGIDALDGIQPVAAQLLTKLNLRVSDFMFFFVEDGNVIGVSAYATVGVGDNISPALVNLGPVPENLFGKNKGEREVFNEKYGVSSLYQGNISDSRISELRKIISENEFFASKETRKGIRYIGKNKRINEAKRLTSEANSEIKLIQLARSKLAENEREVLKKTSDLILDMGEKISSAVGREYKSASIQIANEIKNFQGKRIRGFDDAMKSLNKVTSNPNFKMSKADKEAVINAWRYVNANDMANKLKNLSNAFKVFEIVNKVEKVREKSIIGYETGNWGPLMLEVESWVISGVVAGVALGLFAAILATLPISGLALTALSLLGIMGISYLASFIDAGMAEKINNEIIRPAS